MWHDFWGYFFDLLIVVVAIITGLLGAMLITTAIVFLIVLFTSASTIARWVIGVIFGIVALAIIAFVKAWKDNH